MSRPLADIKLENLQSEYFMGIGAPVQNIARLATLWAEIQRMEAEQRNRDLRDEMGLSL